MARRERGGFSDLDGVGVIKNDLDAARCRGLGSMSARFSLGGNGSKECGSRTGKFDRSLVKKDYALKKYEWECLLDGRRNGDEYCSPRRDVVVDCDQGNRFREFGIRRREDIFQENVSSEEEEEERERWLRRSCRDSRKGISPLLGDRRFDVPADYGNAGVCGVGNVQTRGQLEEEGIRSGRYLHEEDSHRHMRPSQSQYRLSKSPSFGHVREARENLVAGEVEIGKILHEDFDLNFEPDYVPLDMSSPYDQPQSRTASPLCVRKLSECEKQLLMKETSAEGKLKSRRGFVGERGAAISADVISSPSQSRSNAGPSLSRGNGSEDGEINLTADSASTETVSKRQYLRKDDGPIINSDYGHHYMMPSLRSKPKTMTPQTRVLARPESEREHRLIVKQAVSRSIEREKYINEEDTPGFHNDGFRHVMISTSKNVPKTLTPMPASHPRDPVAESDLRYISKSRQRLSNRVPLQPSYLSGPNPEIYLESSTRSINHHLNDIDEDACALHCGKGINCKDQNCIYVEEDARTRYISRSHELDGKRSKILEDCVYAPGDRPWINGMEGADPYGHCYESKSKTSRLPRHYQCLHDHEFRTCPHHNISPHRQDHDFEDFHENILPHEVEAKIHYHEERENENFAVQQDKYARHDSYFMDEDFHTDKGRKVVHPVHLHDASRSDGILHGHTGALLSGRYKGDNHITAKRPCVNHQEDRYKQLGERAKTEHLSDPEMQCQMLMKRSAHIQNKDFTEVGDEALDNTTAFFYPVSFKNLPLSMQKRLGKPQNSASRDIKKRLGPCPQINDFHLPKKHKLSKSSAGIQDICENHQGRGSDSSLMKGISGMADLDEDSQKFKGHVHRSFLEFAKHLFESSQQRKYTGLDKYESLSCDICDREFKDAHSLAKHAFSYVKTDKRAQHLGLHKALCVLMGWNSLAAPNNPISQLILPESEHLALKEDLIIWPPVVIVHNSSLGNKDLLTQKIITTGKLESLLEGEGFARKNYKVHLGNDQSIMIVRFNATLSGLQAAEELHSYYAKNKHGRVELQHIITSNDVHDTPEDSQNTISNAEEVLFGYLGIVEDLPKLDTQIKKWSLIKSRKELLAAASP